MIKYSMASNLRKEGFLLTQFESTILHSGDHVAEDCEAAGHTAFLVKKKRAVDDVALLSFSFLFSPGPQPKK